MLSTAEIRRLLTIMARELSLKVVRGRISLKMYNFEKAVLYIQ